MGQKINPTGMRIGINQTWKSMWYDEGEEYIDKLQRDVKIRDFVREKLKHAGLDRIEITRTSNIVTVSVYVARPGVAIGRGGEGIDLLQKELARFVKGKIEVKVNEVKKSEMSASVIAHNVVEGLEGRQHPKKLMVTEKEKAMQAGAKGVRIWISGDFGVPKQSRTMKISEGVIPLQTLRAHIDFARESARIRNAGLHGVKVWVHKVIEDEDNKSAGNK